MSFDPFCLALLFVRSGAMQRCQSSSKPNSGALFMAATYGIGYDCNGFPARPTA